MEEVKKLNEDNETENEIWKDIEGYEGYYQVSNLGNVFSFGRILSDSIGRKRPIKEKMMKNSISRHKTRNKNDTGYFTVRLTNKDGKDKLYFVHRLVAITFIDNQENLPTVNHKDGNKLNNKVSNLEWNSFSQNSQHAYDTNIRPDHKRIAKINKTTEEIEGVYNSIHEAGRMNNLNYTNIHRSCKGYKSNLTTGGFKWNYISDDIYFDFLNKQTP